ncbi:antichymotrypsin-2-like [Neocloeon triangulifer]|uniref:antichymotrypsin-2-like n=1 Tax=Neocloeon triangulifer TaxID=2078957 RepID=UPI00286FA4C4|nr:antichymotrypsin-2-like [Neocloeon triangulifer]
MRGLAAILVSGALLATTALANDFPKVTAGSQNFGRDLYQQFSSAQRNVVISPLSAYLALAVTRLGTKGRTQQELNQVLGLDLNNLHEQEFISLQRNFATPKDSSKVVVANKVFLNNKFQIQPKFVEDARNVFHTTADTLDFSSPRTANEIMNNWVKNITRNKITSIMDRDTVNDDTKVVVVNVMYFRGPWNYKFYSPSEPRPFYLDETNTVSAQFMSKEDYYGFVDLKGLDAQLIELPYRDNDYSFVIISPKSRIGLSLLESRISGLNVADLVSKVAQVEITLHLPKFQIDTSMSLNQPLSNMGIKSIFSDNADLTGLSAGERLKVSEVFQKNYFEINENGTEAAASTSIRVIAISAKLTETSSP